MHGVLGVLRHLVTFSGRARRREFWLTWLIFNLVGNVASQLTRVDDPDDDGAWFHVAGSHVFVTYARYPALALVVVAAVPLLAVTARRLHDSGLGGRWLLLALTIPAGGGVLLLSHREEALFLALLGPLILAGLALRRGDVGANRFGPDPKVMPSAPEGSDASRTGSGMSVAGPSMMASFVAPIHWYVVCLRRYAVFDGRARRREFWWFMLVNVVVSILATVVDQLLHTPGADPTGGDWLVWFIGTGLIHQIYDLAMLVPTLAVCWRRMHDTNRGGGYTLIAPFTAILAIPGLIVAPVLGIAAGLIGPVIVAALAAQGGTPGPNSYGPDPKGPRRGYDPHRDGPGMRAWPRPEQLTGHASDAGGPVPPTV